MGTKPWFALRALGLGLLILLTAGIPTLVIAQPDQLAWEEHKTTHDAFLFLVGTVTTITGIQRLYSSLYKKKNDLDHMDLANMPPQGKNLGEFLNAYIMMFTGKIQTLQELREHDPAQRLTPDASYSINKETREALTQTLWRVLDRFEELETIHEGHVDEISNVTDKLRDLMALPDEETLENMLQHTEELLKFAKGIKREFNQWFPEETNTTLENVIKKLEEHFQAARDVEEHERSLWEAALRTCLPKAYHQRRPGQGQEPLIPSLWASAVQACLDSADAAAQKVRDQVAMLSQQITGWEQIGRTTQYNNNIVSPDVAAPIIAKWKARADYSPIFSWIKISAAEQDKILSGQQLKETMETAMVAWLDQTNQNIPSKYRDENTEDFADRLNNSILQLRKGINRMSKFMSGVTSTTTNVTEDDADNLRNLISPKYFPSSGPLNYKQLLDAFTQLNKERLDAITTGKQPIPSGSGCQHPEEAARALHQNPQTVSWADSLDEMTRLYDLAQNQPQLGNPPAGNDDKLFRASEVPEFKERKEYWSFRSSLNRFVSGVIVRDQDRLLALNRILSRFTGKEVSDAANRWNVSNLAAAALTWPEAYTAFLKELDRRFLTPDFATQQEIRFKSLRVKDMEPQDFINEFETRVRTLEEALELAEMTPIENGEIMRQLMSVLPGDIRSKIKDQFRKPEEEDFFTITPDIIRWWMNINAAKPRDQHKRSSRGGSKAGNNPAPNNNTGNSPSRPQSHPTWGTCNKPCWDEETPVPNGHRGPYMGIQRSRDNICPRCRRGKNEHGGHPNGCQHYGSHHWHNNNPGSRSNEPSGNDAGDS